MKIQLSSLTVAACMTMTLSSCGGVTGKEVARLSFHAFSTKDHMRAQEAALTLKAHDKVAIWSHMDMEYNDNPQLRFQIQMLKDSTLVSLRTIDPTDNIVTLNEVKTEFNGRTSWSFTGRNSIMTIPEDGHYTFRVIMVAADTTNLVLKTAEVVLKKQTS